MRSERVHMVVAAEERAAYRAAAERRGLSLSAWLRAAAEDKLEEDGSGDLGTVEELDRFFDACDERQDDAPEPDWDEHLAVISSSRGGGPAA